MYTRYFHPQNSVRGERDKHNIGMSSFRIDEWDNLCFFNAIYEDREEKIDIPLEEVFSLKRVHVKRTTYYVNSLLKTATLMNRYPSISEHETFHELKRIYQIVRTNHLSKKDEITEVWNTFVSDGEKHILSFTVSLVTRKHSNTDDKLVRKLLIYQFLESIAYLENNLSDITSIDGQVKINDFKSVSFKELSFKYCTINVL